MLRRLALVGAMVVVSSAPVFAGTANATVCSIATDASTTVADITEVAELSCTIDQEG